MPLLTERIVEKATAPGDKPIFIYDTKLSGYAARITPSGVKTLIIRRRVRGVERQVTIGRFGTWSVAAAREEAMKYAVMMDQGIDPVLERRKECEAPTFNEVWEKLYVPRVLSRKNDLEQKNEQAMMRDYIRPVIGNKRIKEITSEDIAKLHRRASENAPVRANRVLAVTKSAFNRAIEAGWIATNPTKGIKKNTEEPRERYVTAEERVRLMEAIDRHPNQKHANIVRMLLLTGARRNEVQSATWEMFDFERGVWTKPSSHTKQKRTHVVPLSAATVALLREIRRGTNSRFVFPQSDDPEAHTVEIRKFWVAVLKKAKIENLRIHDLRHDFASTLVSNGYSLPIIGKLLGHTQTATTARYAHLMVDPLREAADMAAEKMGFNSRKPEENDNDQ